jgi:hypothetical protein
MTPTHVTPIIRGGGHNWGFPQIPIFVELTEKNLLGLYPSYDPPPYKQLLLVLLYEAKHQ